MRATPRTDPGVRHYRTGLLPRVLTISRSVSSRLFVFGPAHGAGRSVSESRTWFALPNSPWPNPFPPPAPQGCLPPALCSWASPVLWVCPTSRRRSSRPFSFWILPADRAYMARPTTGSPGFRATCFHACMRSATARGPCPSRDNDAHGIAFQIRERRRHLGRRNISRLNTQPARSPVNACPAASRRPSHDSGPVWFAIPSLQETFTPYTLPALPGASPLIFPLVFPWR